MFNDLFRSLGFSLLIVSPYFMEKVSPDAYFAFDIVQTFLIPHIQATLVLGMCIFLTHFLCRKYWPSSRKLLILIVPLFLLFELRALFLASGLSPQVMAHKIYDCFLFPWYGWPDPITFIRIGTLALFGLSLLIGAKIFREPTSFFRASAALGWILGCISLFHAVPLIEADSAFLKEHQRAVQTEINTVRVDRRVVWIIFDELDYSRVFRHRNPNLVLPNLDRLQHTSVSFLNAASPAGMTAVSIPALITGSYLSGTQPLGPARLMLQKPGGIHVDWGKESSIFTRVHDRGGRISIVGFYHPYCSIFPYVNTCLTRSAFAYAGWWWAIWQGVRVIPGVDLLSRKYHWTNEGFNRTLSVQLHEINRHLTDNATTLTFIHLNVPHLPGARTDGLTMTRELKALSGYEQNLFTVDRIVGDVVNSLEAQSKLQDILLIISSDHWLRTKYNTKNLSPDQVEMEFGFDTSEVHKIPLLIRRMRETSQFIIPQPINTIHTANLIDDFLAGKVSNHASIATWWLSKPYSPPIIGAERE